MNLRLSGAAFAALLACTAGEAFAAEKKTQSHHALGLDIVRLLDNGQFEPNDGVLNLFYQGYLTKNTAWTLGHAWGEFSDITEFTYKIYNQGFQNGSFWQVGLSNINVEGTAYENDIAVLGAFGFERSPADHLVVSTGVKALVGIDHPRTGEKDIVFLPTLSVLFTF